MSILAQQDIRNTNNSGLMGPTTSLRTAWKENLGIGRPRPATTGFGGFTYSPVGLQLQLESTNPNNYDGPIGNDIADSDGQYGPEAFARLDSKEDGSNNASSLLGAFGIMLNEGSAWGKATSSQKMKITFTSGKQTKSLRNASLGVADTPIASGGPAQGYQADQKYGMNNYTINELNAAADAGDEFFGSSLKGTRATEEVSPQTPIENTGLRNIPDMG